MKSKDFAQRRQRKGGEKSEKDRGVNRRDAEDVENFLVSLQRTTSV
jgi:hypothetical protein